MAFMREIENLSIPASVERRDDDFFVVFESDLSRRQPSPSSLIISSTSLPTGFVTGNGRSTGLPGGVGGVLLPSLAQTASAALPSELMAIPVSQTVEILR